MHFIVCGAGIAGLGAAVALQKTGHRVTLIERAPALSEVGAGVVMGSHAMKALAWLGADSHIRMINHAPEDSAFLDANTGDLRTHVALRETGRSLYGATVHGTHRRDLIDALSLELNESTTVMLGKEVVNIDDNADKVTVHLKGGETISGDAVIGADGLKSTLRGLLFGEVDTKFTNLLAWRTVMPMSNLAKPRPKTMAVWVGGGHHAVSYPIRGGKQFYAAFYVHAEEIQREDWSQSGDLNDLRASFADASPDLLELINGTDEAFITGIFYRDPLPTWSSGRTLLIGDAAHSVIPTSGSGAALALEDAVSLSYCLQNNPDDLAAAFNEFELRRKPRTTRVLNTALTDMHAWHSKDPNRATAAAARARGMLRLDPTGYERQAWLYSYDVVTESERPLEDVLNPFTLPNRAEARTAFEQWRSAIGFEQRLDEWISEREAYNRFVESISPLADGVVTERVESGDVAGYKVYKSGNENGPAILHLHGGYHVYGSARSSSGLAARLAEAIGGWAFVPDYALAPEADATESHADVLAAYRWLTNETNKVFLSGEDAGASLAVYLSQILRNHGERLPLALYLLSPFVDKTLEGISIDRNEYQDAFLNRRELLILSGSYTQGGEPRDAVFSPVFGNLEELPPMRIFCAESEALRDDARLLKHAAKVAGTDVELIEEYDSVHNYALFESLPESARALEAIAKHAADLSQ